MCFQFYFYEEEKEWDDKEDDKGEKTSNWEVDNRWDKIEKVNSAKNKTKAEQQVSDNKWAWNYNYETEEVTSSNKVLSFDQVMQLYFKLPIFDVTELSLLWNYYLSLFVSAIYRL